MTNAVLVGSGNIGSGTSLQSSSGTTTAGTLLVYVYYFPLANGGANITAIADNKSNVFTPVGTIQITANGDLAIATYKCEAMVFGAGHVVTVTFGSAAAYASIEVVQVNAGDGSTATVVDKIAQGNDTTNTYALTTAALSIADEVVVFACGVDTGTSDNDWTSADTTILHSVNNPATFWPVAVSKVVVAATTAVTGTFSYDSTHNHQSALFAVSFRQAPATAVTPASNVRKRSGPFRFERRETRSYTNPVITQIIDGSGTSSLVFTQAATITARVNAAASATLSFVQQAVLTARVNASGNSSLLFTSVAQAVAYAIARAASALSFSSVAQLLGYANASASSSISFNAAATVGAYADFRGNSSFNFSLTGTSGSSSNISGSAVLSFVASGIPSGRVSMQGSAVLSFSQTAFLAAFANARVTASIAFDVTGTLTNKSSSSGAVSFTFAASARLSAFGDMRAVSTLSFTIAASVSSPASMAGSTSLSFTATGRGASIVSASGASSLIFAASAGMKVFANMKATAPFTFVLTAQAHTYVELNGSTSISFTCEIDTGLVFPPGAAMFDISFDQREFNVQSVERTLGVN